MPDWYSVYILPCFALCIQVGLEMEMGKQGIVGGSIARPIAHYTSLLLRSVRANVSFVLCLRP